MSHCISLGLSLRVFLPVGVYSQPGWAWHHGCMFCASWQQDKCIQTKKKHWHVLTKPKTWCKPRFGWFDLLCLRQNGNNEKQLYWESSDSGRKATKKQPSVPQTVPPQLSFLCFGLFGCSAHLPVLELIALPLGDIIQCIYKYPTLRTSSI